MVCPSKTPKEKEKEILKILVIPDSHAHPDYDNKRADYLAKLIIDETPDVVVNIGDKWDFNSLSSYDKGKRSFHGRSYKKEVAGHSASRCHEGDDPSARSEHDGITRQTEPGERWNRPVW